MLHHGVQQTQGPTVRGRIVRRVSRHPAGPRSWRVLTSQLPSHARADRLRPAGLAGGRAAVSDPVPGVREHRYDFRRAPSPSGRLTDRDWVEAQARLRIGACGVTARAVASCSQFAMSALNPRPAGPRSSSMWLFDRPRRPDIRTAAARPEGGGAARPRRRVSSPRRTPASTRWSSSRGSGARHRGRGRQPVPRLHRRHRRHERRALPPGSRRRDPGPGRQAAPHVRHRLLLQAADRPRRAARRRSRPGRSPKKVFFTNSGAEALEGGAEARPLAHRPEPGDRVLRRVPRPHLRGDVAVRVEAGPPPRVLAAGAGHPPRRRSRAAARTAAAASGCVLREARSRRRSSSAIAPPDEVAAIFVEPIQGEGGYHPLPPGCLPALRQLCDQHGILLVAGRGAVRAWAAPARCSPSSTAASSRTSSAWRRASPAGMPLGRDHRQGET